jgi:tetratricopeptide (TPR) repeat protein
MSLKAKIVMFAILSLVGIYVITSTAIENREKERKLSILLEEQKKEIENSKIKLENEKKKQEEENKRKQEEQKIEEEKKAALEEKYNKSKDAFIINGNYTEAIKLADEIIKEDPDNYKAYNIKGITLCYESAKSGNGNKYNEGMAAIDKALQLKPDFGYARFNKALAYELFGHYAEALQWYDKALEVEDYVWSYYGISSIYGRRGDIPNTIKYLKIAIEKDPIVKEEAATEVDFNNVRSSKEFKELINK